jgi:hypothetical protein
MTDVPRPQDAECVDITFNTGDEAMDEGVANGVLSNLAQHYEISYNVRDGYVVEGRK